MHPTDIWSATDYPVLQALAAWYTDDEDRPLLVSVESLIELLGWGPGDERRAGRSLDRLAAAGLIEILPATSGRLHAEIAAGITPAGLSKAGAWPSEASAVNALKDALEELARAEETESPEKASKLREAAGIVGKIGVGVVTEVAAKFGAHLAGLG